MSCFNIISIQNHLIKHVKLSNSKFNKLKVGLKNGTEVTLKLPSNVVGDSGGFLARLLGSLLKMGCL